MIELQRKKVNDRTASTHQPKGAAQSFLAMKLRPTPPHHQVYTVNQINSQIRMSPTTNSLGLETAENIVARRSESTIVLYAHDTIILVFLIAVREYIIRSLQVDGTRVHLLCPMETSGANLRDLYNVSPEDLSSIVNDSIEQDMPIEFICSDSHVHLDSLAELRNCISFAAESGAKTILSLIPDGSSNRTSLLSDLDILDLFGDCSDIIVCGTFFSFGFLPETTPRQRPLFSHAVVCYFFLRDFALSSGISHKDPYNAIVAELAGKVNGFKHVIWVPLRAICNDKNYHDGMYEFGRDNPVGNTLLIYKALLKSLHRVFPETTDSLIVFVGDVRTKHVLADINIARFTAEFGQPCVFIEQPLECRFDFLFSAYYSTRIDAEIYLLTGDSTTAVPLFQSDYKIRAIFGYPTTSLSAAGANAEQLAYIRDRVLQWYRDSVTVAASTLRESLNITTKDLGDGLFYLSTDAGDWHGWRGPHGP